MPLRYIEKKQGWQYGTTGKVYKGKGSREKARKQGQAIEISKLRAEGRLEERNGEIKVKASNRARSHTRNL